MKDTCLSEGESVSTTVAKICRHSDQAGRPVLLLTLTDGTVTALYVTSDTATAMVAAMGGDGLRFDGVALRDLKSTYGVAVKAAAGAVAMAAIPRAVDVKSMPEPPPMQTTVDKRDAFGRIERTTRRRATASAR